MSDPRSHPSTELVGRRAEILRVRSRSPEDQVHAERAIAEGLVEVLEQANERTIRDRLAQTRNEFLRGVPLLSLACLLDATPRGHGGGEKLRQDRAGDTILGSWRPKPDRAGRQALR